MPSRIQRKRTAGWRTPECSCGCGQPARYVGRGSKWGNPFRVVPILASSWTVIDDNGVDYREPPTGWADKDHAAWKAVSLFEMDYRLGLAPYPPLEELRGHDLLCWCRPESPCHADYLISAANPGVTPDV